ncbi:MAG: RnfABCDGE type electron transport complex subunit G [Bacteroidales bacterium]|jgi:electron transport complex protein RnfG|nr:RnfABCDGE type electron transport complex subunit G [Bacteroidales bacterium]MDD4058407.1 RnfABCDGE type electron transport complex subunit G [Bacteroidales bacterium]
MARESTLKNMVLTLASITLLASTLLGGVYVLTKSPIDAAKVAKINSAISKVVPEFDNDPSSDKFIKELNGKKYTVYPAKRMDDIVGYAVESFTTGGFGGRIVLMVGFNADGTINNTSVLSHTETPGLGDKMVEGKSDFSVQFQGKSPENYKLLVKKDGGDVDAITASTITSRAFCDAVTAAWEVYKLCVDQNIKKEGQDE